MMKLQKKISMLNSLYTKKSYCSGCKRLKTLDKFNKSNRYGRQRFCRICQKNFSHRYYKNNKTKIISMINKSKGIRIKLNHLFIAKYKLDNPCVDCLKENVFNTDIRDLTFDHIKQHLKSFDISYLATKGYSITAIKNELAKCEVVCWKHHRVRESKRQNDYLNKLSINLKRFRTTKTKKQFIDKEIARLSKNVRSGVRQ